MEKGLKSTHALVGAEETTERERGETERTPWRFISP
jgi:hypothetical protein